MGVGDWITNLLFAQLGTASTLEIAWTLVGLLGFILTVYLSIQAWIDLSVLKRAEDFERDGPRHLIALDNISNTMERAALFGLFVATGILAMATRSANGRPSTTSIVFDSAFIAMECALARGAIVSTRTRARVFALLYARSGRTESLQMEAELSARLRGREKPLTPP